MLLADNDLQCDAERVSRLLDSPDSGWGPFWAEYSPLVRRRVGRWSLSPEDAADVLQDISLRLIQDDFRLLRAWDPGRCCLRGYLVVIVESMLHGHYRSEWRRFSRRCVRLEAAPEDRAGDPLSGFPSKEPTPRDWTDRRETERRVAAVLRICFQRDGLNPTDRAILHLHLFAFQFAEIADDPDFSMYRRPHTPKTPPAGPP